MKTKQACIRLSGRKGDWIMGRFDKYTNVLAGFKRDIESVATHQNSDIDKANREYNKSVLGSKISEIKAEYNGNISSIRKRYLSQLDEVTASMRGRNSGKYRENYIDFGLLEKFNIIARSGVQLTSAELESFTKDAMTSRSSFCVRKCQLMANQSGFKLNVPSEEAANEVIDEVDKRIRSVIKEYSGKPNGHVTGYYMMLTVDSSGGFIKRLEEKYEDATLEDVTITQISKNEYEKMQQEIAKKAEDKDVEITELGQFGVKANPVMDNSPAAQYIKGLSQKMATRTE